MPEDLRWFDGHFPGRPVVPGIALVHWALTLAQRELGLAAAPSALESVKFQQALLPGADFELTLAKEPTRVGWRYAQDGAGLASGRARFDAPPGAHEAGGPAQEPEPGLPVSLPQTGPMRLIDSILTHEGRVTLCRALVRADSPGCAGSEVPSWFALEWLAQAMAAAGGAQRETPAGPAFLASARRLRLATRRFRVGEALWIRAEHLRGERGAVAFACALGSGGLPVDRGEAEARALAHGALTAFVA